MSKVRSPRPLVPDLARLNFSVKITDWLAELSQRRKWLKARPFVRTRNLTEPRTFEWTSTTKGAFMLASLVA